MGAAAYGVGALNSLRVLGLVPARGGSKGLPGKNLRALGGIPLLAHSVRCALQSKEIARTVVTTDSDAIAAAALEAGADVPFRRPAELASDQAAMWPVVQHAVRTLLEQGDAYDAVMLLDPTSPWRTPLDIARACELLAADPAADGVVAVSEPPFSPYWHCVVRDGPYMRDLMPGAEQYVRRQDLPPVFRITGALYLWRTSFVLEVTNWRAGHIVPMVMDEGHAVHIDTPEQFELAELLLERGLLTFPWMRER